MFDHDDMSRGFLVAAVIVGVGFGASLSIAGALNYGADYNRVLACVATAIWTYIAFRATVMVRRWYLQDEVYRSKYLLKVLKPESEYYAALSAVKKHAEEKLKKVT